jgi:hypothetical protein
MTRRVASPHVVASTAGIVLIAAAGVACPSPATADSVGACTPVEVAVLAGTGETNPSAPSDNPVGLFRDVTNPLVARFGNAIRVRFIPYSASAWNAGLTYAQSKQTGVNALNRELGAASARCPATRFVLGGYSQGADAVGDAAVAIGNGRGPIHADRVLAVGTISDPGQGTSGEMTIPPSASVGVSGPRPEGAGALRGRWVTICHTQQPVDLYCSMDHGHDPILSDLGRMMTHQGIPGDKSGQLAASMTSDYTGADLGATAGAVSELTQQLGATGGQFDPAQVTSAASSLLNSLRPIAATVRSVLANPTAMRSLQSALPGSAQATAAQVLGSVRKIDFAGAIDNATRILDSAQSVTGAKGSTTAALTNSASSLAGQLQPATSDPSDALTTFTNVMSTISPDTVVKQVLNVAAGLTEFAVDVPAIVNDLTVALPQKVLAKDIPGVRDVVRDLNTQFTPMVRMGAGVDLAWISQIVTQIPSPHGETQIAGLILQLLSGLDVVRIANDIGAMQEVAWSALLQLQPPPSAHAASDPVGAGLTLVAGLAPIGLDLASAGVQMFTGGQKLDPSLLGGRQTDDTAQATGSEDLPALSGQLTQMNTTAGAQDLGKLVGAGIDAASFYGSNVHGQYDRYVVDPARHRTAPALLADWFTECINTRVAAP